MMFFGIAICLGCTWLGLHVAGPLEQATRLHNENDVLERDLRRAEIRNQDALKQLHALDTDQGIIVAARARGFMFSSERPLHIQSEGTPASVSEAYSENGNVTRRPSSDAR